MLRGTRLVALSAALAAALLLTGCADDPAPAASVAPLPSDTPRTYSNSRDLFGAAKATYEKYLKAVDRATATQADADMKTLHAFVSSDMYRESRESIEQAKRHGLRAVGSTRLVAFREQQIRPTEGTVSAYACLNFKNVRLLNVSGKDVTPAGRSTLQQYLVTLADRNGVLVVSSEGAWNGSSVC